MKAEKGVRRNGRSIKRAGQGMWASCAAVLAISLGGALLPVHAQDAQTPPPVVGSLVTTHPDDPNLKWGPCPGIFPKGCEVTILSGQPDKSISDVYLRAQPGVELNEHWHNSPEHVVLVKGKFSVTFAEGRKASLEMGAYTLIPAGMKHSARCEGPDPCVIFIGFEKPVDAFLPK